MTQILFSILGVSLLALPLWLRSTGHPLGALEAGALMGSGAFILMVTGVLLTVTRLYQKTKASEAFVRTGLGGARVIRDGGALTIPFVHELMRVSLQTIKLEVSRENADALITKDKLRADVRAEFFVRVQPDVESILQASRSLGEKMQNPMEVRSLVEDKLVSALRTAAASRTLEELNSERDEFLADAMRLVGEDLKSNGLVLETVTISRLDQTDDSFLKAENIFDAQGRRKIAEITQHNLTERNRLVREGEQHRKEQDVLTKQAVLDLERREREAEAVQIAGIARVETEAMKDSQVKSIEAQRAIELATVEKQKALEIAAQLQEQAVEIAGREKQERVAEAEQKRALAERGLAEAEAEREQARQTIETLRVRGEAERAKSQRVLAAEAEAEMQYIAEQRRADGEAYAKQKQAEAQRLSADAEAEAVQKRAQANAEAERQKADGERARAMVPVEVRRAEVEVERDHVASVIKAELEARERHGRVAQEFEIQKLRVAAEKEVRIAMANAQASLFTKMEANLYGTTADVEKLLASMVQGQSLASTLNGFLSHGDEATQQLVNILTKGASEIASAAAERLSGKGASATAPGEAAE
jgi:uncharacterized membrane protein YqiK